VIAVIAIYVTALLISLLVGVVVSALLDLDGRWLTAWTLPLGAATAIALLYPLGYFMRVPVLTPVFFVIVLLGLAVVLTIRLRRVASGDGATRNGARRASALAAFVPRVADMIVLMGGALAGLVVLAPLLRAGFPTTIASTNNDGWAYVANIEWLQSHAFGPTVKPDMTHPTTFVPFAQLGGGFGVGFELLASMTMTVLRRNAYEMVNAVSAIGVPIAAAGWACLWQALTGRLERTQAFLALLAVASPVFLLPYTENYTPQFVAICFWPLAAATFVRFARSPSVLHAIVAGIASAAVIGVYPPMLPWLLPLVMLGALIGGGWPGTVAGWRDLRSHLPRLRRFAFVLVGFALAILVVAPIQLRHTLRWFTIHDSAAAGIPFPRIASDAYLVWATGTNPVYGYITGSPVSWQVIAAAVLVVPIFILGLLLPLTRGESAKRAIVLVTAAAFLSTAIVFIAFRVTEELGYGLFKTLINGGAMLAGLLILSLIPLRSTPHSTLRYVAIGILVAVWIPVSGQLLQMSYAGTAGFRKADIELGRALDALPPGSEVLIEGAAEEPWSFQVRMMQAYFGGDLADQNLQGLGTTSSYIAPGGQPEWRPTRAWTYVVTIHPDSAPFGGRRERVWTNGVYTLWRAPQLDATPYGPVWYAQESDDSGVFEWTAGNVQLVVSNRSSRDRMVSLRMKAESYEVDRTVTVGPEGQPGTTFTLPGGKGLRPIAVPLRLPAHSATGIVLTSKPGPSPAPDPDPRTLSLRIQDLTVVGL
jgi:hypothetical protein